MADPRWTPGPWYIRERTGGFTIWSDHGAVTSTTITPLSSRRAEGEANARLVAAAPDLYEALEMVRDANESDPHIPPSALAKIHAALAKARGEAS